MPVNIDICYHMVYSDGLVHHINSGPLHSKCFAATHTIKCGKKYADFKRIPMSSFKKLYHFFVCIVLSLISVLFWSLYPVCWIIL